MTTSTFHNLDKVWIMS